MEALPESFKKLETWCLIAWKPKGFTLALSQSPFILYRNFRSVNWNTWDEVGCVNWGGILVQPRRKRGGQYWRGGSGLYITSLNSHFPHQETQHQMLRRKKAEPRTPHFLSLNQTIVTRSQEEKCGLKYVIHTFAFAELPVWAWNSVVERLLWTVLLLVLDSDEWWSQDLFSQPYYNLMSSLWVLSRQKHGY